MCDTTTTSSPPFSTNNCILNPAGPSVFHVGRDERARYMQYAQLHTTRPTRLSLYFVTQTQNPAPTTTSPTARPFANPTGHCPVTHVLYEEPHPQPNTNRAAKMSIGSENRWK